MLEMGVIGGDGVVVVDDITITTERRRSKVIPYGMLKSGFTNSM